MGDGRDSDYEYEDEMEDMGFDFGSSDFDRPPARRAKSVIRKPPGKQQSEERAVRPKKRKVKRSKSDDESIDWD